MGQKTKFYNMTKPTKFRRLKLFYNLLVLWCGILRERIIYSFNYILYKLHIYKRYSYKDKSERVIPIPQILERSAYSPFIRGIVKMDLWEHKDIDLDYFYRVRKDGSKKITLWLRDKDDTKCFTRAHLENINLRIANGWYDVSKLPRLKVAIQPPIPVVFEDEPAEIKPLDYETVTYDIGIVKSLIYQEYIGQCEAYTISEIVLEKCYDHSVLAFYDKLGDMTLNDLLIKEVRV